MPDVFGCGFCVWHRGRVDEASVPYLWGPYDLLYVVFKAAAIRRGYVSFLYRGHGHRPARTQTMPTYPPAFGLTVGADKAYDTKSFRAGTRALNVTAHVQKNEKGRRSNLDARTTRHAGYDISLSRRWLIEKTFGWLKQTGPLAQVKLRGLAKVDWAFVFSCAAHNLLRLPRLIACQDQQGPQQQCA